MAGLRDGHVALLQEVGFYFDYMPPALSAPACLCCCAWSFSSCRCNCFDVPEDEPAVGTVRTSFLTLAALDKPNDGQGQVQGASGVERVCGGVCSSRCCLVSIDRRIRACAVVAQLCAFLMGVVGVSGGWGWGGGGRGGHSVHSGKGAREEESAASLPPNPPLLPLTVRQSQA